MTKLVSVSPREMARILKRLGFEEIRRKGSHAYFGHRDGRATVIPLHEGEDLGKGLIRSILRDIDISVAEYDKLRRRAKRERRVGF